MIKHNKTRGQKCPLVAVLPLIEFIHVIFDWSKLGIKREKRSLFEESEKSKRY